MTRINSAIPVKALTDEHLLAEHREIKRICAQFKSSILEGKKSVRIPECFTLGTAMLPSFLTRVFLPSIAIGQSIRSVRSVAFWWKTTQPIGISTRKHPYIIWIISVRKKNISF